jgi:hypothetical protein
MRYLVRAKLKRGKKDELLHAFETKTLGQGSIAAEEYLHDMAQARVSNDGTVCWVEVCFCHPPLEEERPFWEKYFDLLSVRDAHARQNCRHETDRELWACCDCDCTRRLEKRLQGQDKAFLGELRRSTDHPQRP